MSEKKIKLTYIIAQLRIGGAERQLAEVIKRLPKDRFEIRVCLLQGGGALRDDVQRCGVDIHELGFEMKYPKYHPMCYIATLTALVKLVAYFRKIRPDVVHCQLYWSNIFGSIAAKLAGVPSIITSRLELHEFKFGKTWKHIPENWTNRFITTVFVNSLGVKRDVIAHEKIDPDKIRVIYNGVELGEPDPSVVAQIKEEFGITPEDIVIGSIANLHHYKGHREIILAAKNLLEQYHNLKFIFVGRDRPPRIELEQIVRDLGIESCIHFAGERSEISEFLHMFDIFVLASHQEGFSNAILEAMAAGLPSVVTNVGGNPEQIEHEKTGFIIEPRKPDQLADALSKLVNNPALRRQFGDEARNVVHEKFSMDALVHNFQSLYEELYNNA